MSEYYNVVPWAGSEEWLDVFQKLEPSTTLECKKEALNELLIWKARSPLLPSGIESTITLLTVKLKDFTITEPFDADNEQIIRLAYSTAIMRFVNHMFDEETAKGTSLYQAAINLNVPSWVVDLRHDTSHSNTLPTVQLLQDACEVCFKWLYENYWLKHKPFIKDFIINHECNVLQSESKIEALMNLCVSLSVCAISESRIKNLDDIPDASMRESIQNDIVELFGNAIDFSSPKTTSITTLINLITILSKRILTIKDATSSVTKVLLSEESLLLSIQLLQYLDSKSLHKKKTLNRNFIKCFEVVLTFLHTNDLLQDFILQLIKLTRNEYWDGNKCMLAALWVSEILQGLKRSSNFIERMKSVKPETYPKTKNEVKALFQLWYPNEIHCNLVLDLEKSTPPDLTRFDFIKPIISAYNPYLTYFIKDLLCLIQPQLPNAIIDNICNLAEIIANPKKKIPELSRIYTVNDLVSQQSTYTDINSDDQSTLPLSRQHSAEDLELEISQFDGAWKKAMGDYDWSSCPIGSLPWRHNNEERHPEVESMDIM